MRAIGSGRIASRRSIASILSATVLDVIAWGGDPRRLEWFERPREDAIDAALALLERLGAVRRGGHGRLTTEIGGQMRRLPLHPRLARMLVAAGGAREMAQACALLSERHFISPARTATPRRPPRTCCRRSTTGGASRRTSSASRARSKRLPRSAPACGPRRTARRLSSRAGGGAPAPVKKRCPRPRSGRPVLAGYPDRVAQRREAGSPRVRLSSGAGAVVAPESGVRDGEFLVALDVQASARPGDPDGRIRVASRVEREWLQPTASETVHRFDPSTGVVKASMVERYDALVLAERPAAPDPEIAARLLADAWLERGPRDADLQLVRRLSFAGRVVDLGEAVNRAAREARSLDALDLAGGLPADLLRALDRDAPETIVVPSGRTVRLEYAEDGGVSASVKLQELFGLAETPRIGRAASRCCWRCSRPTGGRCSSRAICAASGIARIRR